MTKNGALILPKLDIASEIPVPVDLMEVGKLSVVINENSVKAKVLQILLNPTSTIYIQDLLTVNCIKIPIHPDIIINIIIHLFRYILSQK